jgi:hypothetical protein
MTNTPVLATSSWKTNGELIADVAALGYLRNTDLVLDPTYGLGRWWTTWRPGRLEASDLDPAKSPTGLSIDFTDLPWEDASFDVVAFDPPYKLNGTPTVGVDDRYGVHEVRSWQQRHQLIVQGLGECARVVKVGGHVLLKCQDQVCSGAVRWQTIDFTIAAHERYLELVDRFDMLGGRPQPAGRRQVHARRNTSTLLIFRKSA